MPTVKDLSGLIGLLVMCLALTAQGNGWMAPPDLRKTYSHCRRPRNFAQEICLETFSEVRDFGAPTLLSSRPFRYRLGVPKKPNYKCDWKLSTCLIGSTSIAPKQTLQAPGLQFLDPLIRCELCSWR